MDIENLAEIALSYDWIPIPLKGKVPVSRMWQNVTRDDALKNVKKYKSSANNIGILTGIPSNIVVVDVEAKNLDYWNKLVEENGGLETTFTVQTGTGGRHYYYKYDDRFTDIINGPLIKIGDFRTTGGQIVMAGSTNYSTGEMYMVMDGYDNDIPDIRVMPDWIYRIVNSERRRKR